MAVGVATLESTSPPVSVRRHRSTTVPINYAGHGQVLSTARHRCRVLFLTRLEPGWLALSIRSQNMGPKLKFKMQDI
ncbi:unnamed protein product [Macrosiphum euphorbiae]|uniref:Uncharacterized protein n=1 Tax=Macrosiphum euphorbiae TaxID=13131 RepID=A0AAV0W4D4_9HEMI|nr:unnamed protein product [Macrosiphum euphorbiae]